MAAAPVLPVPPAPNPEPARLSQGARIVDTFIAPSKTFSDLRRSAAWWAPWLLISVLSVAMIAVISKQVGFEQASKYQIAHSARADRFDQLSPDQQQQQLQLSAKIIAIFSYGVPVFLLLYCLVATVALWATFKIAFAAETTFGQAYAIVMYSWLPGIIGALLGIISLFAGASPEGFDIKNPVGTNLAYYLDPETTGTFVRGMASALDILTIWTIILAGIGFSCNSKIKRSTAIIVVAVWYLLYKLVFAAIGA
jgi:Yip1 domain